MAFQTQTIKVNDISLQLQMMGYSEEYIFRAINVHKKSKRGTNYDLSLLVEIIFRLKKKDAQNTRNNNNKHNNEYNPLLPENEPVMKTKSKLVTHSKQQHVFIPHLTLSEALKLSVHDNVDYRFENGRWILCQIIQKSHDHHHNELILLHPLGVNKTNTKHNRLCNLHNNYYKLAKPKSISLRKTLVTNTNNPLLTLEIDDYVDINPKYRSGHQGWKYGRIIKKDTHSSQYKVLYYNTNNNTNQSYWFHIENTEEIAPFKTKCKQMLVVAAQQQQHKKSDSAEIIVMEHEHKNSVNSTSHCPSQFVKDNSLEMAISPDANHCEHNMNHDHIDYTHIHGHHNHSYSHLHHSNNYNLYSHSSPSHSNGSLHGYHQARSVRYSSFGSNHSVLSSFSAANSDHSFISNCSDHENDNKLLNISQSRRTSVGARSIINHINDDSLFKESLQQTDDGIMYGEDGKDAEDEKQQLLTPSGDDIDNAEQSKLVEILHQLYKFGYDHREIQKALKCVSNPMDINEIIEFLSSKEIRIMNNNNDKQTSSGDDSDGIYDKPELIESVENKSEDNNDYGVFGVQPIKLDCTLIPDKDYGAPIPNILINLEKELFKYDGHLIEGIFRMEPNNNDECKQIENNLNNNNTFCSLNFGEIDGLIIAYLIKLWFRKLPRSILQDINTEKILKCKNMKIAGDIIENEMGEPFESYYKWLLDLCIEITKYENKNKMSIKKLAVVMAPNLLNMSQIDNPLFAVNLSSAIIKFVQLSILWRHFHNQ